MPIFWKMLASANALEILAHRIVWAFVFSALWVTLRGRWRDFVDLLQRPATVLALLASTLFIATNWGVFIWAVNHDRVLETSLGYFINPLVSVVLGLVFLGERLNARQWFAVALAAVAVVVLTVGVGVLPWVSLVLAFSFGFYGLVRKVVNADAVVGLVFETAALTPLCVVLAVVFEQRGLAEFGHNGVVNASLFVVGGLVTAVPLIMFTRGVRRIALSTAGLLQYIAPTCTFLLAVFVYGEAFSVSQAVGFVLIWTGLAVYTYDLRARFLTSNRP